MKGSILNATKISLHQFMKSLPKNVLEKSEKTQIEPSPVTPSPWKLEGNFMKSYSISLSNKSWRQGDDITKKFAKKISR